jgi:hypothetical protein
MRIGLLETDMLYDDFIKESGSLRQVTDANFIGRLILDLLRPAKTQLTEKLKINAGRE